MAGVLPRGTRPFALGDDRMNPRLTAWEDKLYDLLREIDAILEDKYGHKWPLHPSRPARGIAANPQYDGLFRITASFTAGYGSELGAGYVFRVEVVTLSQVPADVREVIEIEAAELLRRGLPTKFPGRQLSVERDGRVFKIFGDLSIHDTSGE